MNYSKKSTSRKQKALKSRKSKMGKKLGVVFLKTLLVLFIAVGVAGLCDRYRKRSNRECSGYYKCECTSERLQIYSL